MMLFHLSLLLLLLLFFCSTFRQPCAWALVVQHYQKGTGSGVIALFHDPDSGLSVAGTKKGSICKVTFKSGKNGASFIRMEDLTRGNKDDPGFNRTYPIFSLCGSSDGSTLFCGGGDRYVSVWSQASWTRLQRLGPHTGWVKGLAFNPHKEILYSIGCNCIETWKKKTPESSEWIHYKKSSIKSSPTDGCTLSSDLLCLCLLDSSATETMWLVSGGVDGRIHVWDSATMEEPIASIPAHSGRVNALGCAPENDMFISASSDGSVKVWDYTTDFQGWSNFPVSSIDFGMDVRITAILCFRIQNEPKCFWIIAGTNTGTIVLLSFSGTCLSILGQLDLEGAPLVNALNVIQNREQTNAFCVLVGHSKGLSRLNLKDLANK